jgi:hypothetical protein
VPPVTFRPPGVNFFKGHSTKRIFLGAANREQKYAVTRLEPLPRSISHLSEAAAESWCLDSITVPSEGLSSDQPFWIALEYEAQQPPAADGSDSSSSPLTRLIPSAAGAAVLTYRFLDHRLE